MRWCSPIPPSRPCSSTLCRTRGLLKASMAEMPCCFATHLLALTPSDYACRPEEADADGKRDQMGGFFIAIANDKIIAGRGLSGGVALWTRVTPSWELSKAVDI